MSQPFDPNTASRKELISKCINQKTQLQRTVAAHEHNLQEIYRQNAQLRELRKHLTKMFAIHEVYEKLDRRQPFVPQTRAGLTANAMETAALYGRPYNDADRHAVEIRVHELEGR